MPSVSLSGIQTPCPSSRHAHPSLGECSPLFGGQELFSFRGSCCEIRCSDNKHYLPQPHLLLPSPCFIFFRALTPSYIVYLPVCWFIVFVSIRREAWCRRGFCLFRPKNIAWKIVIVAQQPLVQGMNERGHRPYWDGCRSPRVG